MVPLEMPGIIRSAYYVRGFRIAGSVLRLWRFRTQHHLLPLRFMLAEPRYNHCILPRLQLLGQPRCGPHYRQRACKNSQAPPLC